MPLRLLLPSSDDAPDLDRLYVHPPGVRLGMVASVDGAATVGGGSQGLSGEADRLAFRALRRAADVVLVGAGTVRAEAYRPVRMTEQEQAARVGRGQAAVPRVAVVSRTGDLDGVPLTEPGSGLLLLTTTAGAARAPAGAEVEVVGADDVEPAAVLAALTRRGLLCVLCEGGPSLNGMLLRAGLVDEVCATVAPLLAGGDGPRLVTGADEAVRPLRLAHLLGDGDVLLGRWVRAT